MKVLIVSNSHGGALLEALREDGPPDGASVDVRAMAGLRAGLLQITDGILELDEEGAAALNDSLRDVLNAMRDLGLVDPVTLADYDLIAFYRSAVPIHSFMVEPFRQTPAGRPFYSRAFLDQALGGAIRNTGAFRMPREAAHASGVPVVFANAPFPRYRTRQELALGLSDRSAYVNGELSGETGNGTRAQPDRTGDALTLGAVAEGVDAPADVLARRREAVHDVLGTICERRGFHLFRQPTETFADEVFTHPRFGAQSHWLGGEQRPEVDLRHMNGAYGSIWLRELVRFGRDLGMRDAEAPGS